MGQHFYSRLTEIEAVHWDGENFWDPVKWGGGKVQFIPRPLEDDDVQEPMRLLAGKDGAQEWVPVPVGHWLVCQPGDKSDIWLVDADYFATKYTDAPTDLQSQLEDLTAKLAAAEAAHVNTMQVTNEANERLAAKLAAAERVVGAAKRLQIERNGYDGSLQIKGGNDAVEELRLALAAYRTSQSGGGG